MNWRTFGVVAGVALVSGTLGGVVAFHRGVQQSVSIQPTINQEKAEETEKAADQNDESDQYARQLSADVERITNEVERQKEQNYSDYVDRVTAIHKAEAKRLEAINREMFKEPPGYSQGTLETYEQGPSDSN